MRQEGLFVPALLVVDMQEDFCAPHGSLGVSGGRELAPVINDLLQQPFAVKVATKDFHPPDHISFHTNHAPPNNHAFTSTVSAINPYKPLEKIDLTLWPVHCVQGTAGANIIPELDSSKFDYIVEKGRDKNTEMLSAFADVFGNKSDASNLDLGDILKGNGVTHVYVVGLAGDVCVKCTAIDAKQGGFETIVVQEGTRSVDEGVRGWGAALKEFQAIDVAVVSTHGPEVGRVRSLASA